MELFNPISTPNDYQNTEHDDVHDVGSLRGSYRNTKTSHGPRGKSFNLLQYSLRVKTLSLLQERNMLLRVFSVTPFKIDKKNENRSIDKIQNLGNERRPLPRFMSAEYFIYEISEEMFYPYL